MKEEDFYKVIKLPHLRLTVYIQDLEKLQGIEKKGGAYTMMLNDGDTYNPKICVFFQEVEETVKNPNNLPIVAHEVMHVIQNICQHYSMDITTEMEHTAYIMSYLIEQITGFSYAPTTNEVQE